MQTDRTANRNWFEQGGQAYARFRPEYPAELALFLASVAPNDRLAVDVGCGNGQLTQHLAAHFQSVMGFDSSVNQIDNAPHHERIQYQPACAEQLPVDGRSTSLITAAQAAHWFNLPSFYQEVRRIAVPGAVLALISYGVLDLEPELNDRFQQFYWHEIALFWPPERKLVDTGYASIDFPFQEIPAPTLHIQLHWTLEQFLGYVHTWSAVRQLKESGPEGLLQRFVTDMSTAWGDEDNKRLVTWPINMRLGLV